RLHATSNRVDEHLRLFTDERLVDGFDAALEADLQAARNLVLRALLPAALAFLEVPTAGLSPERHLLVHHQDVERAVISDRRRLARDDAVGHRVLDTDRAAGEEALRAAVGEDARVMVRERAVGPGDRPAARLNRHAAPELGEV